MSRKVVESYGRYGRSDEQKTAFIESSDFDLLGLDQQLNRLLATGKRKASAWALVMQDKSPNQNGIGLGN